MSLAEGLRPGLAPRSAAAGAAPLRVAVVGAGYASRFHLAALATLDGVHVAALCDTDAGRAAQMAARWQVARAVSDLGDLAGLGIDVAHVAVPPDRHAEVVRRLLDLGIGAFVEKPLTLGSRETRELGRLAAERGLPIAGNDNALHHPAFRRLLARLGPDGIGRVEHVRAWLRTPLPQLAAGDHEHFMFRGPGNIVLEQAVHPLAQVHALVGAPRTLSAVVLGTRRLASGRPFHHRWLVAAQAERGTAEIYLDFGDGLPCAGLEVLASDGVVEADLLHDLVSWQERTAWIDGWDGFLAGWRRGGQLRRDARRGLLRWAGHHLGLASRRDPFFAGMRGSIAAFYARLAAGELPAGADAAASVLEWCEAVVAAADRPVAEAAAEPPLPSPARPGEVVVLGGGGLIGRRLVARLLDRHQPVTLVTRRSPVPASLAAAVADGRLRVVRARLEDPPALARAVAGARVVVHAATGGGETWEEVRRAMVDGTVEAARAAAAAGVERFVFVSSIAALYLGPERARREVRDDEGPDPRPAERDPYSRGKILAELALGRLHRESGLPVVVVRPGVVLGGAAPQHDGLGYWVQPTHCIGWGRGRHPLPVVTADDVADGLARVVLHDGDELHGRSLNLCSRAPLTAAGLVAELARASGRPFRFHPRPLWLSQLLEIGKWLAKRAARRRDAAFPAARDLRSRALAPPFACETARGLLGWAPLEEPGPFLDQTLRADASNDPAA